ncbi:hypothetical protein [Lysobacter arvi]|uniref:Uncharacterized protein n=1 Tax=Lysobacter arvi TaxID=3038776 RepID=A0ABU1CFN1_9GAMM|nr:hypothetical protein [Lysobacter arvi]MDR0183761.1 hypothetical protein [Lysobacter arvi]
MKQTMLACALMLATGVAMAKDKAIPLTAADAAALRDKTVALTVHERPSFSAMTAGKASFGLFGAGAMISAGNKLVDENGIADPAITIREQLAAALNAAYGAKVQAPDTTPTKATKPKELAALHPQSDYVLDVRSGGWMYAYYPTDWNSYWVGYSAQVQLIDTRTARQVSNLACNANTNKHANPPSRDALHADGAKLLKDITASLGWNCVQLLAKQQFNFPEGIVAATPAQWVDPQAAHAHSGVSNGSTQRPGNGMTPVARTTSNGMTPAPQPAVPVGEAATSPSDDANAAPEPTAGG